MPTKTKATLKKQDPPAQRTQRYDWAAIAEQVKAQPGTWFLIYENDNAGFATSIRNNDIAALRKELGFTMRTADNTRGRAKGTLGTTDKGEPRRCSLYLRWDKKNVQRSTNKEG